MRIEAVDLFYLAMPEITDEGDSSQDALLVRVAAGGHVGFGECEAAPLPSIAAFVCPKSHGACHNVGDPVLGAMLDGPDDIARIARRITWESMDLLQAAHTWSGVEMALWDLLGRAQGAPAWSLLGIPRSGRRTPYASALFGPTPQETLVVGRAQRAEGFRAVKFGWGPIGRGSVADDVAQLHAAREGIGEDAILLVDAGQIFGEDVEAAAARLPALEAVHATWFEEPFAGHAYEAYAALARHCRGVRLAGGEASHNAHMARHLMAFGGVGFVQIDCGRIGGIGPARRVAELAAGRGVTYVNHTFTSSLALSASLQPFADAADGALCEYPVQLKPLARAFTANRILRDADGMLAAPDCPGLGIDIDWDAVRRYLVETEITVEGRVLYRTPKV
ncbi:MAG: mandelate racemase/muconate lactonizing enzyme family protein [Acetobacteraceae bacterium]|nr:mandelate racemase/muconate lactonizing enzyme family protein [Acetobacteraceae bacterium]